MLGQNFEVIMQSHVTLLNPWNVHVLKRRNSEVQEVKMPEAPT